VTLLDGDGVLLSAHSGFTLTHPARVIFLGLRLVPVAVLGTHLDNIDDAVMQVIRRDTPALALLTRYIGIALDDSQPATSELQGLVANTFTSLPPWPSRARARVLNHDWFRCSLPPG
jgi:hypothetical protein